MNDNDRNKVQRLIAIYERRINKLQSQIDACCPIGAALLTMQSEIKLCKLFLADLNSLVSPKPSRFEIRAHNNFEEEIFGSKE